MGTEVEAARGVHPVPVDGQSPPGNNSGPPGTAGRLRGGDPRAMDPRPARKIIGLPIDAEGNISYRLSMDQISTLAVRLHVDLRRQASAVCPGAACAGGRAAAR